MYFSIYTLQVVCVTRFDQSECVMCRVIFALANMSRFQRCICAQYMVKFSLYSKLVWVISMLTGWGSFHQRNNSFREHNTLFSEHMRPSSYNTTQPTRNTADPYFTMIELSPVNIYTIRPWKVVGTLNLDSSYVTFTYFAFLSICY